MTRPTLLSRVRNPKPAQLVTVALTGDPKAVADLARALATIAVITGMNHHATTDTTIRIEATCYRPGVPTLASGHNRTEAAR
jgi:hypothetical protein